MFNVINLSTSLPVLDRDGEIRTFDNGTDARLFAKELTAETGIKHQPRKMAIDADWRAREQARFASGEYTPVVWAGEFWASTIHYAHVSKKNPKMISYTENEDKGRSDIQTMIKPGVFLKKFYGNIVDPAYWSARHAIAHGDDESVCLKFAETPDEIERVYLNGPDSCMSKDLSEYESQIHPVCVYGGESDLTLAYLENDGKITGRALVWPIRKVYVRIYGDALRLEHYLAKERYQKDIEGFFGAKLNRIPQEHNCFLMPYLDGEYQSVQDKGDCFIICKDYDGIDCTGTEGLITLDGSSIPASTCYRCDEHIDPDAERTAVHTDDGIQTFCCPCAEENTFFCHGLSELFDSNYYERIEVDGLYYSRFYARDNFHFCNRLQRFYRNQLGPTLVRTRHDRRGWRTDYWCDEAIRDFAFKDAVDGELYAIELRSPNNPTICVENEDRLNLNVACLPF